MLRAERSAQMTATGMAPRDMPSHTRQLPAVAGSPGAALPARSLGQHHASIGGNALRAAVLGANDGLVSNFSLVMGVAGASAAGAPVLIAGLAGLLAGSLSMALGEWLSVQSARELYERQIAETAGAGVDVEEIAGSAWTAAVTSFLLFALGAIVPVIPFVFASGQLAILASAALSALALFSFGAAVTLMTARNPVLAGLRQVGFGLAAAGITYAIGTVLGTTLN